METQTTLALICLSLSLLLLLYAAFRHLRRRTTTTFPDNTTKPPTDPNLTRFPGGDSLTAADILEAPGSVLTHSPHGSTLYLATLPGHPPTTFLLRFIPPDLTSSPSSLHSLGHARHPNLVPLLALYVGPRRELLLVHPFYPAGDLSRFIISRNNNTTTTTQLVHRTALGIARGLQYLHSTLNVVHGNLKTKNVVMDDETGNYQPRISDFGLHLVMSAAAGQEMLQASAAEGYKAPELMKMKEASRETDVYSLGVILLEMVNGIKDRVLRPGGGKEEEEGRWLFFVRLAMACCSPAPALRPDIKQVVRRLEEIGW